MLIDLHIHSSSCSDGAMTLEEIFAEAVRRGIQVLSVTDHDSIDCQETAMLMAKELGLVYIPGLELNVSFSLPAYRNGRPVSLDFLAYDFDACDPRLAGKLRMLREQRRLRAERILDNLNREFVREGLPLFDHGDMEAIEARVDGAFGRPHIADYMVEKGLTASRQEAFDRYLVKCNEPKTPVSLEEASNLVRGAGGKIVLAHANDPNGTSLAVLTPDLHEQQEIVRHHMLPHIDGVECWHSRHDRATTAAYVGFARKEGLIMTGGSDCHQRPLLMGSVPVPDEVLGFFGMLPRHPA
jgi:3',5'-nucleoside bisphosphate phosphatase